MLHARNPSTSNSSRYTRRERLASRAAALAIVAALLAIMGSVAVATAFERSRSAAVRAASTTPLAAATGAALWARAVRAQLRRAESQEGSAPEAPVDVPAPTGPSAVEEERRASADLLAIDEVVRVFYRARSASDGRAAVDGITTLLTADARLDLRHGGGGCHTERSRTVHVIGDFAVVISAYEVERPGGHARGVAFLQLRLAPGGWSIHDAVSRGVDRAVTERLADPRPLARREGTPGDLS